ncbi:MAG: hypothetical protein FJX46_13915 [Alphaproteobacteria bacterium]|nr:hypothetical protein [Alphaproteobacteria bacterium]
MALLQRTATVSPTVSAKVEVSTRLDARYPVHFAPDSCLIVRRPGMTCGLCRDACPVRALGGGAWNVALQGDACVGCGLCAAACPTGALEVEGFGLPATSADLPLAIECRRVPAVAKTEGAASVPCLGGLDEVTLVAGARRAEGGLALIDRGWCAGCEIGRCPEPWRAAQDEAQATLRAIAPSLAARIRIERRPLPTNWALPMQAATRPEPAMERRALLRGLLAVPSEDARRAESRRVVSGRGAVEPRKTRRLQAAIAALAAAEGVAFPAQLRPKVAIGEGCDLDGICAAICPTEALWLDRADGKRAIRFRADWCMACGECQRACRSRALRLGVAGEDQDRARVVTLVERATASCVGCESEFVALGDEELCPTCRKSVVLMQAIAGLKPPVAPIEAPAAPIAAAGEKGEPPCPDCR